jgi:EipB-like
MQFSRVSGVRSTLTALAFGAALGVGPAFAAGMAPLASAAGVTPLASHRAVYDLTLGASQGNSAPADATGRIAFEFTGSACEGYVMNFRQVTELQPAEGSPRVSDMRSSTYEDGDAKSFRFHTETIINDQPTQTIDGSAKKDAGALAISLTEPQKSVADVGQNVAFPTEQIVRILDAARAGRRTLPMKVFDGSDTGKKIYNTLAVIGPPAIKPPTDKAAQAEPLRSMRRWPVTISYFEEGKDDSPPDYVLSFDLYENGVSGRLRLNYGDFTLKGELTHFTLLPQKGC